MSQRATTDREPTSVIFRDDVRDPIGRRRHLAVQSAMAVLAIMMFAAAEIVFAASLRWAGASVGIVVAVLALAAIPLVIEIVVLCRALQRRLLPSPIDLLYKRYGIRRRTLPNYKIMRF